MQWC